MDDQEKYKAAQYDHYLKVAQMAMEGEQRRKESLLTQASRMQTAFAFTTAAMFAALPVCIENKGEISNGFLFSSVIGITMLLLLSLFFATWVQWRYKGSALGSVQEIEDVILKDENWKMYINASYRDKQITTMLKTVYEKLYTINEKRVKLIIHSMVCYFAALVFIMRCLFYVISAVFFK